MAKKYRTDEEREDARRAQYRLSKKKRREDLKAESKSERSVVLSTSSVDQLRTLAGACNLSTDEVLDQLITRAFFRFIALNPLAKDDEDGYLEELNDVSEIPVDTLLAYIQSGTAKARLREYYDEGKKCYFVCMKHFERPPIPGRLFVLGEGDMAAVPSSALRSLRKKD